MDILAQYINGNTEVVLYQDGTKERIIDGSTAQIIHPESIDVKITNYCDAKCQFCHESSTIKGLHGDLLSLLKVLSSLPAGVELALGGGNPLSHPDLIPFLHQLKQQGIIVNITVNQKHLSSHQSQIISLIKNDLIKGLGISYSSSVYLKDIEALRQVTDNIVFHLIMGINTLQDVQDLIDFCSQGNKTCKILVLGYKQFGFGINYYLKNKKIEDNKYQWYTQLAKFFKKNNLILSFDNLAIKQLSLKRYFTDEAWDKFYMGDDGQYTMYIDAVEKQYAISSTSDNRVSFQNLNLLNYFKEKVKNKNV